MLYSKAGHLLLSSGAALLALTVSLPAVADEPLPVIFHRTPPPSKTAAATSDEERPTSVRLLLLDGRTIADAMPLSTGFQAGIDPESVEARRLGPRADDPVLVTWTDYAQGQGNYQVEYYVVLSGGRSAAPLLRGALDISGHTGTADWSRATLSIERIGEFLIRRIELASSYTQADPAPGCQPMSDEPEVFLCESASAAESRYRLRGETLEAVAFEELMRLEPGIDLADLLREGWRASADALPRVGAWLRRQLPLAEGAAKYPAVGPLATEP